MIQLAGNYILSVGCTYGSAVFNYNLNPNNFTYMDCKTYWRESTIFMDSTRKSKRKQHAILNKSFVLIHGHPQYKFLIVFQAYDIMLPMENIMADKLAGDIEGRIFGNGAHLVPGKVNQALRIYMPDYVVYSGTENICTHNPEHCSQGITFAMWLFLIKGRIQSYNENFMTFPL